ncbi:hypothetical protein ElyMa_002433500 [Elysia marginata]|uniref:Uncharacterized protein n=1 Tax=Elysia marginata TaxID=1093978 RepID=A0AAV4GH43_9GAST|nr:hypothetical protein ElyMa_002433500 [Elysia marginata]
MFTKTTFKLASGREEGKRSSAHYASWKHDDDDNEELRKDNSGPNLSAPLGILCHQGHSWSGSGVGMESGDEELHRRYTQRLQEKRNCLQYVQT